MSSDKLIHHAKVALKSNPKKYHGKISNILKGYNPNDIDIYSVRWDGFSQDYLYVSDALITEAEAKKLAEESGEEKSNEPTAT